MGVSEAWDTQSGSGGPPTGEKKSCSNLRIHPGKKEGKTRPAQHRGEQRLGAVGGEAEKGERRGGATFLSYKEAGQCAGDLEERGKNTAS